MEIIIIAIFGIWLLTGYGTYRAAVRKGRSGLAWITLWFVASILFLGILGGTVVLIAAYMRGPDRRALALREMEDRELERAGIYWQR